MATSCRRLSFMMSLQGIDEITENFRGYILRCPCTFEPTSTEEDTNQ